MFGMAAIARNCIMNIFVDKTALTVLVRINNRLIFILIFIIYN